MRRAWRHWSQAQTDFINAIPVHQVGRLERHPRIGIDRIEGLDMYFLMMNIANKPFDNKLVRQIVNHSVDASAIVTNILTASVIQSMSGGSARHRL